MLDSYFAEHPKGKLLKDVAQLVDDLNKLGTVYNELQEASVKANASLSQLQENVTDTEIRLSKLKEQEAGIDSYLQTRRKELEDEYLAKHSETLNQIREERLKISAAQNELNVERINVQNDAIALRGERTKLAEREADVKGRSNDLETREKTMQTSLENIDKREVELAERETRLEDGLAALKEQQALIVQLKADRELVNSKLKEAEDLLADARMRQNQAVAVENRNKNDRKIIDARFVELDKIGKALKTKEIVLNDRASVTASYSGAA